MVVVETPDAALVAHRNHSQYVQKIVTRLEAGNRTEQSLHCKVHRTWGWYAGLDRGSRFQVKKIMFKLGPILEHSP